MNSGKRARANQIFTNVLNCRGREYETLSSLNSLSMQNIVYGDFMGGYLNGGSVGKYLSEVLYLLVAI